MKRLLVVVDYQNDFVSGSLGFKEAVELEPLIAKKIQNYRQNGDIIAFTFDTHDDRYLETREGKALPIPHCLSGSDGWQLFGSIAQCREKDDPYFIKNCFGSRDLFEYLRGNSFTSIEFIGVVTNMCVLTNAVLAQTALPNTPILIDAACVASNDRLAGEKSLDVMESLQMKVLNRR